MKIGMVTTSWSKLDQEGNYALGGVGWYRCGLPAIALAKHANYECILAADVAHSDPNKAVTLWQNQQAHSDCDLIVINMWMNKQVPHIIDVAHNNGQKVILDMDDWLWQLDKAHVAFEAYHTGIELEGYALKYWEEALQKCDAVTCSTPFIYNKINEYTNKPKYLLRNAIDLQMFNRNKIRALSAIGWMGGIPWRSGDLEKLKHIVPAYLEEQDLQFVHVGYLPQRGSVSEKMLVPRKRLVEIPGLPIFEYPFTFQFLDIGLVPLKFIDFNQAKSALKGMEYAASGVPFIASSTKEYEWFDEGIICSTQKQWRTALNELVDPEARKYYAEKAYQRVTQEDINLRYTDWQQAYEAVLQ